MKSLRLSLSPPLLVLLGGLAVTQASLGQQALESPASNKAQETAEGQEAAETVDTPAPAAADKIENVWHLPNAHRLPGEILSGGLPADEQAFRELAELGVKTVISVDGAKPDVELARRFGMRYVHLPIGYDGVPESRIPELAKAVSELPRPIYFHCHHGKHRSSAAAVVACIANGLIDEQSADTTLGKMGTAPHYVGLYRSADQSKPIAPQQLANFQVDFAPVVEPPPTIHAMLEIEHLHHALGNLQKQQWKPAQANVENPAHLALLLKEQFVEMERLVEIDAYDVGFGEILRSSIGHATILHSALQRSPKPSTAAASQREKIDAAWRGLTNDCTRCHHRFRDTPQR